MPKSKEILDSDDDLSSNEEKKKPVAKKLKTDPKPVAKKAKVESESSEAEETNNKEDKETKTVSKPKTDKKPAAKKAKSESEESAAEELSDEEDNKKKSKSKIASKSSSNKDAENGMYMLSKMRFVSVSEFRGQPLVNIREYYESNGKTLPGKKGISLSLEQWTSLKSFIGKIDNDLKKFK